MSDQEPIEGEQTTEVAELLRSLNSDTQEVRVLLSEVLLLVRVLAQPILDDALSDFFDNRKQLRAYELSDGERSTREIGAIVGVDQKTVSTWWRKWRDSYQIVDQTGRKGQYRARYSLLGLVTRFAPESDNSSMTSKEEQQES